jgi:uncharacterized protein (DUF362 family)/Pyruvate/2-oxoacid:ferredoxin oxidoreductase delta subunit
MSKVSLLKYSSYNKDDLLEAIKLSCKNISFDPANIAGSVVAVKPNLLTAASPESGVTTHPGFFRAVVHFIKENKGTPVLVESPAFFHLDNVLKKCGYSEIIETEKIQIADTSKTSLLKNDNGKKYKSFHVAEDIVTSDFIFNLPKLKTHSLTYFTGAVKNLFGTIHGLNKSKWHVKTESEEEFISFLLDLYGSFLYSKKDRIVSIMDGIIGMEGEGPGKSGRPVLSKAVIAGMDALAVDTVAVTVAGLDISRALICVEGEKRGLGVSSIKKIDIAGASLTDFSNNFLPPKTRSFLGKIPMSTTLLKNLLVEKPVPDKKKCTLCYQCKTICPAGVIEKSRNGMIPYYDYSKCIRCYCCMEICPEGAIFLKRKVF